MFDMLQVLCIIAAVVTSLRQWGSVTTSLTTCVVDRFSTMSSFTIAVEVT